MVASDDRYGLFLSFGIMTSIFAALSAGEQALNGFQHFDGLTILFPFFLSLPKSRPECPRVSTGG
jgi:hypothetical protein